MRGEASLVKDGVHKISRAIARKRSAGAIGSMSPRREPRDQNASLGIAESRYRTSPVGLIPICLAFGLADSLAVGAQSLASFTLCDIFLDLKKNRRKRGCGRSSHSIDDSPV
jgi:hypothetical protein